jgi:hypothetical protein
MGLNNLILTVKATVKTERFKNQVYKTALFGLLGGIVYYSYSLTKPHGTFGQKRMLEGEDSWAND